MIRIVLAEEKLALLLEALPWALEECQDEAWEQDVTALIDELTAKLVSYRAAHPPVLA